MQEVYIDNKYEETVKGSQIEKVKTNEDLLKIHGRNVNLDIFMSDN